ncbi:MAG: hypothetical protein CML29_15645 [Rhizobiales bacterium]|nr:hypothetical protein [Hyphomicrobiales bacterium]MBA70793.1 hypothetical protein [Hyphomicrobiales bacterium]
MTDLVLSTDHDLPEDDADYAAGVRQVSLFFAAVVAAAVASTAIFGFAGLITFFVAAAALMLVTLVALTLG